MKAEGIAAAFARKRQEQTLKIKKIDDLRKEIESGYNCTTLPKWLERLVVWFFDHQTFDDAKVWGLAFYAEIDWLNGDVPFSVLHDWQARYVVPKVAKDAEKRGLAIEPYQALVEMHVKAAAGEKFAIARWAEVLRQAYGNLVPETNTRWRTPLLVSIDAVADAYAYTDPNVEAIAYVNGYSRSDTAVVKRLADGMIDCLSRVSNA